ncbi:MAG TPA: hypothetical protein VFD82_14190 [Planctomycetota bacterium]|nr:hypothetical protein [Planctomycetota bacterium]
MTRLLLRARRPGSLATAWALLLLAGCSGEGSDIGPTLPPLPKASCKVVVLDDLGRGVVGASVSVGTAAAVTGRNGRTDLFADPRGRVLIAVNGANAAAVAADRLAALRVATTVVGPDLPSVFWLPDLPDSASATLTLGTQVATTAITSTSTAVLTVPAGCSVGLPGSATTVTVRAGVLQASHLPGDLPSPPTGAILFGRGLFVDPPAVTFAPAADLDVADDLLLGGGTASLYRLDDTTGEWAEVASGITNTGGRIIAAGAVATGGLYAFGAVVPATTVSGRVVDPSTVRQPVPDVMVNVDHRKVLTDGAGHFVATGVAAASADGSLRQATIELFAGGFWLPARLGRTVLVTSAPTDAGELVLDTMPAGNVRVQQVARGRSDPLRECRISSIFGDVALATLSDANGQLAFEDVPAQYFGFQDGHPIDSLEVFYGQAIAFLDSGRRWFDVYQFRFNRAWYIGARSTRALVTDALGGGPLMDAVVVQGSTAGQGFVGKTLESGSFVVTRDFAGRATASRSSQRGGRTIVHAVSIERPDGDHVELPLQRVLRAPLGAFDRHGLVAGTVTGADGSRAHRLRVTRRISQQEWWEDVAEGVPIPSSLPIDVDPATTHAAFQAGVAVAAGNLAVTELTTGPVTTLLKAGIVADFAPVEGDVVPLDIALDLDATTLFVVSGAFPGPSTDIDRTTLTYSLALRQPSGRVVDVARALSYIDTPGSSLVFLLPDLTGSLQGSQWLALVQGSKVSGGSTLRHSSLISLPRPIPDSFQLPASFPSISAPAPGAVVPASGFTVQFGLPAGSIYATIELRSDSGAELLLWQVYVPGNQTQFAFVQLPPEAVTPLRPLQPGRTWSLTVTAALRGAEVLPDIPDPYRDQAGFVQSIGTAERGVRVVASRTITITTN